MLNNVEMLQRRYFFWTHSILGISPNFSINNFNPSTHQLRVFGCI